MARLARGAQATTGPADYRSVDGRGRTACAVHRTGRLVRGATTRYSCGMPGPPLVIYVDIDDTLIRSFGSKRIPMGRMVQRIAELKQAGADLYCWSSGGGAYAETSARELGIAYCFSAFLPKPQVLLDDVSMARWKLKELHPNECLSMTVAELLEHAQ